MFFVYVDCKPDGTPFYVGKGNLSRLKLKPRVNRHHANICAKYPDWYRGVAFMGSEEDAFKKEIDLIASLGRQNLCNRTNGGEGTSGHVGWCLGKQIPLETKQKISKTLTGKTHSDETKKKMSETRKGKSYLKGYKHTEETLIKMSIASKSHIRTPEWKQKIAESVKANWAKRKQN
jgi:hypothetical protein